MMSAEGNRLPPGPGGKASGAKEICPAEDYSVVEIVEVLDDETSMVRRTDLNGIVTELPGGQPCDNFRRQYVNLNQTQQNPNRGRCICLKAHVEWDNAACTSSLATLNVYWRFAKEGDSPGTPASDGIYDDLPNSMKAGFDSGSDPQETKITTTDSNGWTEVIRFYVGKYGGDAFSVWASDQQGQGGLRASKYHVWRRVYYEVESMQRPAGGFAPDFGIGHPFVLNALRQSGQTYADYFIDLHRMGQDNTPAHNRMILIDNVREWAEPFRDVRAGGGGEWRWSRYFQLIMIDTLGHEHESESDRERDIVIRLPRADVVRSQSGNVTLSLPMDLLLDNSVTHGGTDSSWLIQSWIRPEPPGDWATIMTPRNRFRLNWDEARGLYEIILLRGGLADIAATFTRAYSLKFCLRVFETIGGLSTHRPGLRWIQAEQGPTTIIPMRQMEPAFINGQANTMQCVLHEIGHALGLASTRRPDNTDLPAGQTYRHNGLHCHQAAGGGGADSCVMFHRLDANTQFCTNCQSALKARDLSAVPQRGDREFG